MVNFPTVKHPYQGAIRELYKDNCIHNAALFTYVHAISNSS